jgi:hypothetical protein
VLRRGQEGVTGTTGEEGSARRLLYRSRGNKGRRWGPVWGGCHVEEQGVRAAGNGRAWWRRAPVRRRVNRGGGGRV